MKPLLYAALILYGAGFLTALLYNLGGRRVLELPSRLLLAAGVLTNGAALALRMHQTGHAPMADMYETLVFYSFTVAALTLVVVVRYGERTAELVTIPLSIAALFFAFVNETPGGPLTLVLRTRWFEVHVLFSFAAYALFTLAFSGALLYLVNERRAAVDPSLLRRYQDIAGRSVLWGFFLFSAAMFSGAVWAYLAWGTYWLWEPKVIWSFIVWFYYAGAMHAYYVKDWRGKGLAAATAGGFAVVLFTYLGVSLLMKSSHSF